MSIYNTNAEFWKGKRVLITGHTGFKGSWLCMWLHSLGTEIRGIALPPPTTPALFKIAKIANDIDHHLADIRDYEKIRSLIIEYKPEIIFHLAAQPIVRLSYTQSIETYGVNVMGTVHVLEAARYAGTVRAIVNVTTDKCYDNKEWVWGYREDEPMGGHDPYSSSKGCAELVSNAYRQSFFRQEGIAMATARSGNVIGGGDWAQDRLIPDILRSIHKNENIEIRNPNSIRPWQHVLEPLSGYLLLAKNLYLHGQTFAEGWNFGPNDDDSKTVQWIVEKICEAWGRNATWTMQSGNHPHEANHLKLDTSKAKLRLNWSPRWSLNRALQAIIDWQNNWLSNTDMRSFSLQQIEQYQSSI